MKRAHPRVGGENLGGLLSRCLGRGSSPRGRGKLDQIKGSWSWRRLIPAWAGKTSAALPRRRGWRAHPRVGGENGADLATHERCGGSSPRGRGKPRAINQLVLMGRLIPAWAGKTLDDRATLALLRAHPRVGGENLVFSLFGARFAGSSPRGRGKPGHGPRGTLPDRLIPAWAGKTGTRAPRLPRGPAHPRVGGENSSAFLPDFLPGGSSPRGRGKPCSEGPCNEDGRLIPAWAGKTPVGLPCGRYIRAHPRVGGENTF